MAYIIRHQPGRAGQFRVWSTTADAYILTHATASEVARAYATKAAREARERVRAEIASLNRPWPPSPGNITTTVKTVATGSASARGNDEHTS